MKIAVIGANYVGLVVATCLANTGHDVVAVDIDPERIAALSNGEPTIYEPGLAELLERNIKEKRLRFTTDHSEAVSGALVVFLCVGTPSNEDGSVNTNYIDQAAGQVGEAATGYFVLVVKSTVPVGTADRLRSKISQHTKVPFDVVSNPEFLKEGAAIEDFQKPDRVVIGSDDVKAAAIVKDLYAPFVRTGRPMLVMSNRSAELTKYAANALLATRISFMNEMANLAERLGADINGVREGVGSDSRIGYPFLFPGVGFGGSCFPKDLAALVSMGEHASYAPQLVQSAISVNDSQKAVLFDKLNRYFEGDLSGKRIAIWGLAFKPRTDDMREAPAVVLIERLLEAGSEVCAFDPVANDSARQIFGDRIQYSSIPYDALKDADALCLVTEWQEFRIPDFEHMKGLMRHPAIFDGRNIWNGPRLEELGFDYFGIGTPSSTYPDERPQ